MLLKRLNGNSVSVNCAEQDDQIVSVTVFQSNHAEVKRRITVSLQKGRNDVLIERLPSCILDTSIRAEGTGNAVIVDVVYHSPYTYSPLRKENESGAVQSSQRRLELLRQELDVIQQQAKFLSSYGKTLRAEHITLEGLEQFLDIFNSRQMIFATRIQGLEIQTAQEQKVYDSALVKTHDDLQSARRRASVTVSILAEDDGEVELTLTYVVSNVAWTPLYDVRAPAPAVSGADSAITLHYRASVTQTTGEDWLDVALTLSTASPQLEASVPTLSTWHIGFASAPVQPLSGRREKAAHFLDLEAEVDDDDEDLDEESEEEGPHDFIEAEPAMNFRQAEVHNAQTLNATFSIPGTSTILSDEGSHKVVITVLDLAAELEWICVPRLKECVFLRCRVANSSEFVLLPGKVSVFMNGNFISKTRMEHVSRNDSFKISLGIDPSLRVTYPTARVLNRTIAQSGLPFMTKGEKYSVSSQSQRIIVSNSRAMAISALYVLDHVPVSTDALIRVNTLVPVGLEPPNDHATSNQNERATLGKRKERSWKDVRAGVKARWAESNVGGDGVVEWACEIHPNAELELEVAWEVKAPVGRSWMETK